MNLEYEVIGDPSAPPLLLIMGLAAQMIVWPDELCRMLADRGFCVVRFDNRDVGLSTKPETGYTLDDMADDSAGLLDALGLGSAHVVGASMGGYIAQLLAIRHPARVRSLCIIMSSTGSRAVGLPQPDLLPMLLQPLAADRQGYVAQRMHIARRIASPGFGFDEARSLDVIGRAWDRCFFPLGGQRQLAAVMAAGDRTAALGDVRTPTLVLHGADDPLVHVSGGEALARAIAGARLRVFPGMAHDLPSDLWPTIVEAIADNARRDG